MNVRQMGESEQCGKPLFELMSSLRLFLAIPRWPQ
jgi:hypothetical protein